MPNLSTKLHLGMLRDAHEASQPEKDGLYGLHWGHPDKNPVLRKIRDNYLFPYINLDHTALEIGPGGGRWTKYLMSFGKVIVVDYHKELLCEFEKNYRAPHLSQIHNNGTDFPGVPDGSVNFVWSFGVFVHLDIPIIEAYLSELPRILADEAHVVIQYSDKRKPKALENKHFSENTPDRMRLLVTSAGFKIVEEDTESLDHSAIMRFVRDI